MDLTWLLLCIIFIGVIFVYLKSENAKMTNVESDLDHEYYRVRDEDDKQEAANVLAKIKYTINALTDHLYNNRNSKYLDYKPYIVQLHQKIRNVVIIESSNDSMYTSYSINKGEQIVFCIRSKKDGRPIHDFNLLMYVVLHEMSHVACPEFNHTPLFKQIFSFITTVAIDQGYYKKIDFNYDPQEYCGILVTDSIV